MSTASEILEAFFLSDDLQVVVAAAREVERLSSGEIKNPSGLLPGTQNPERGGLLCAEVFGPVEDFRCVCGFVRSRERAGEVCSKCGVLCGEKRLRDERWGHVPVAWPVFVPVLAKRAAEVLAWDEKKLGLVAGFRANLNADGSLTRLGKEDETGAESGPVFVHAALEARGAGELMVRAVPVTPAGWRGAKRDAQDAAYARLVSRSSRLKRLLELKAPAVILENDYRELQKNVTRVWSAVREEMGARRGRVVVPREGRYGELLEAVLEQPLEYGVRGVFADWLIEQGDSRGEFVSLQLANAVRAMGKRESELLARHYDEWLAPVGDVVDYVVFRRGFLASCRADKAALPFVGDPVWATVEHLNTDVPELVRQPVMRALSKLSTNLRCLAKLCGEGPLPQLTAVNVRISSCPPRKGWEVVTVKALPKLRELVVLHQSATGASEWGWLMGTPLARKLKSLTLAMALERVEELSIARWLPIFEAHPKLDRLALSYDKKRIVFELVRTDGGVEVELVTTPAIVERACMMLEDTITPALSNALKRLPGGVRVNAAANDWYGPRFVALAKTLKRRLQGAITLPDVRAYRYAD